MNALKGIEGELLVQVNWVGQLTSSGQVCNFQWHTKGQRGQRCVFRNPQVTPLPLYVLGGAFRHWRMSWLTLWCIAILITATQQHVFVWRPLTEIWHGQEVVGCAGLRSVAEKRMATMPVLFTKAGHYMGLDFQKCCRLKLCQLLLLFTVASVSIIVYFVP